MKTQEFKNLRQKNEKELIDMVKNLKKEMTKLRLELSMKKIKNVSIVRGKRKDIARILTILKERKLQNG